MLHQDRIIEMQTSGESRDAIIITLVTEEGMTLNAAEKAYTAVARAEGWTRSITSHKQAALDWLADNADDWDAAAVKDAVIDLAEKFGVAESTARDYCKAYSKMLGVDHPTEDPRQAMFDWLVANAETATKDEFKAFAGKGGLGRSDSNVNEYWKGLELHRAILAAQ